MKHYNRQNNDFIIHPGETLNEILIERNITVKELSRETNIAESNITSIIDGEKDIDLNTAIKLAKVLSIDVYFWINLQLNYNVELNDFTNIEN